MSSMKGLVLGAALLAGAMGFGAASAKAQAISIGFHWRGPSGYVPPCPGPGYFWTDGYYTNGYWVPGAWRLRAEVPVVRYDRGYYRDFDRGYNRGFDHREYRDRARDRRFDGDRDRGFNGHSDRWHEGFRR